MLNLKHLLQQVGRKQSELAEHLALSAAAVAQIVNHGEWPKSLDELDLQERIVDFLQASGAKEADLASAFEEVSEPRANATRSVPKSKSAIESNQEESMLLRKQTLFPATRKHFGLFRDPFQDDIQSHEDMYVSPDIRYIREAMFQTSKHGGLLAVVAESGAGKTTLMRDLEDRIVRENQPILLIRPYVLGMEDNDQKGKTLKATHIAEALMAAVAPLEKPKSSPEARFAQLHKALRESHTAGYRHCLVIDDLLPDLQAQRISRNGQVYDVPLEAWVWAIEQALAARDAGRLTLPLKSHGWLYEVISNWRPQAGQVVAAGEPRQALPKTTSKTLSAIAALEDRARG